LRCNSYQTKSFQVPNCNYLKTPDFKTICLWTWNWLGEFSPFGFEIITSSPSLGLLFVLKKLCVRLDKIMDWATFWAIFFTITSWANPSLVRFENKMFSSTLKKRSSLLQWCAVVLNSEVVGLATGRPALDLLWNLYLSAIKWLWHSTAFPRGFDRNSGRLLSFLCQNATNREREKYSCIFWTLLQGIDYFALGPLL
jgi:hypothetical protein